MDPLGVNTEPPGSEAAPETDPEDGAGATESPAEVTPSQETTPAVEMNEETPPNTSTYKIHILLGNKGIPKTEPGDTQTAISSAFKTFQDFVF